MNAKPINKCAPYDSVKQQEESADYPAATVIRCVASELDVLMNRAMQLQGTIGKLMDCAPVRENKHIYDLQDIDYITQTLEGLGKFLEALANETPAAWRYPDMYAAENIKLGALAARLLQMQPSADTSLENEAADLDLF